MDNATSIRILENTLTKASEVVSLVVADPKEKESEIVSLAIDHSK
jgi:hypothetical protein